MFDVLLATLVGVTASSAHPAPTRNIPTHAPLQMSMPWTSPTRCLDRPVEHSPQAQQASCLPMGESQAWSFRPQADGSYLIVNAESGKCLDVEGHSYTPNARVLDWPCHGMSNQRWFTVSRQFGVGHHAVIWSAQTGQCLDLGPQGAFQRPCNFATSGQSVWVLFEGPHRLERPDARVFQLSVRHAGLCATETGAWMALGPCARRADGGNRMTVVPVTHVPSRFMLRLASGRCMSGTPADWVMWASSVACNANDTRLLWELDRSGNAMQVRNQGTGVCLAAWQGGTNAGTWLFLAPCSPAAHRAQWTLTSEPK